MPKPKKYHYYLVCGTLLYKNEDDGIGSISLNAMVPSEIKYITVQTIAMAQRGLQINLRQRLGEDMPEVVDIVIGNMLYCGFMTQEEMEAAPEGMTLQERGVQEIKAAEGENPFADLNAPIAN
jgi:hypothetical protein